MAYVSAGGVYGGNSAEFMNIYQNQIGGNNVNFKHTPAFGFGLKAWINDNYRISLHAEYFESRMNDAYFEFDSLQLGTVERDLFHKINTTTIPIVASIDYIPIEQQFKTYLTFGAGIVISKVKWEENVNSTRSSDLRVGGIHYNQTDILPMLRAGLGVELDFDKPVVGEVIGSLTFELTYSYMFRNLPMYDNIKNQFVNESFTLPNTVEFLPGYLSLKLQFGLEYFQTIGK
ncbi:MAG: hypothetical protein ACE364_05555 [Chlorobiota bacterium]